MHNQQASTASGRPSRLTAWGVALARLSGDLRRWPSRRWLVALPTAVFTVVFIAVPTDLIDTSFFSRQIPPTAWSWPALIVSAVLTGLVTATYVAYPEGASSGRAAGRMGMAGWLVTFFAVGCPVCNKLVLLALGTTGAMRFFEPVQPYLAAASIVLLGWALCARMTRENSCRLPAGADAEAEALDRVY